MAHTKRSLRHWLKRIQMVKTWQLVVILLLVTLMGATFLRMNNLGMIERRNAVLAADTQGDKDAIRESLITLQRYVAGHMNTSLNGGIYLSKSYERDRGAALEAAQGASNPNSAVYQQASVECRSRFQGGVASFRNDYVQCVIEKVAALSSASDPSAGLKLPRADNYRYDFVSPAWSFDLAGLTVALGVLIILVILTRLISIAVLHLLLKRHYRSI